MGAHRAIVIIILVIVLVGLAIWVVIFSDRTNTRPNGISFLANGDNHYLLVWEADFHEGHIDPVRWSIPNMEGFDTNFNEIGYYTNASSNVAVVTRDSSHHLRIKATRDPITITDMEGQRSYPFSTARLITTASFMTGFFAIRMKVPTNHHGMWPFVHLHPYHNVVGNQLGSIYGRWPSSGEIAIFDPIDYVTVEGKTELDWTGRLQFGSEADRHTLEGSPFPRPDGDFHVYAVEWTLDRISWYLDASISTDGRIVGGKLLQTMTSSEWFSEDLEGKKFPSPAPFNQPFQMTIGMAVGGDRYSSIRPSSRTKRFDPLEIDWIRVYQRS